MAPVRVALVGFGSATNPMLLLPALPLEMTCSQSGLLLCPLQAQAAGATTEAVALPPL